MRGNNKADIFSCIGKMIYHLYVFLPCTTGYQYPTTVDKIFNFRQRGETFCNLYNPVETGISANGNLFFRKHRFKQLQRLLILNKQMGKAMQHLWVKAAVKLEKRLGRPGNGRDQVNRNIPFPELPEVMIPVFVLYPNDHYRFYNVKKIGSGFSAAKRKIDNQVGHGILLPYFISGRRKKC